MAADPPLPLTRLGPRAATQNLTAPIGTFFAQRKEEKEKNRSGRPEGRPPDAPPGLHVVMMVVVMMVVVVVVMAPDMMVMMMADSYGHLRDLGSGRFSAASIIRF
jgi:hypothetical protein